MPRRGSIRVVSEVSSRSINFVAFCAAAILYPLTLAPLFDDWPYVYQFGVGVAIILLVTVPTIEVLRLIKRRRRDHSD